MSVLALNLHAGFECRHSGACCTAGWPIPVEPDVAVAVRASGVLSSSALMTAGQLPEGAVAVIEPRPDGACPAYDATGGRLCTIQRALGHEHLPASCRHFPRVALLETDAVRVTLSHFCPTAAWMLFDPDAGRLAVVHDAAGIADRLEHDGFDARQTVPPFLRPGVAMDTETCRRWEQHVIGALDSCDERPEDALAGLAFAAEALRNWRAEEEPLETRARRALAAATASGRLEEPWTVTLPAASRLFLLASASVPPGLARPAIPDGAGDGDQSYVAPDWADFSRPLRRYLAARFFAAWSAYLGDGLRTQIAMLAVALAVVRIEAVRETMRASRRLDALLLHAAIRSADLLLHHLSNTPALVRSLAGAERGSAPAYLAAIGLEAGR